MKQFDTQIAGQLINDAVPNKTIFIAGENGSGKSRLLDQIARQLYENKKNNIIAISNSTYTRFPSRRNFRKDNYHRYLSGIKKNKLSNLIKNIFSNEKLLNKREIVYGLAKTLDYLGFSEEIGFALDTKNELREKYDPNHKNGEINYEKYRNLNYFETLNKFINKLTNDLYFKIGNEPINDDINKSIKFLDNHIIDREEIQWIKIPYFSYDKKFEFITSIAKIESLLGENLNFNVYCKKKYSSVYFNIDDISSGESSLFSIFQFIQSNINENNTWILIDEPENSLHPKWQRDYCQNILNNFSLYEPRIIIATHSPMIVSGASININNNHIDADKVYTPNSSSAYKIRDAEGVEALLMDVFDTLMPKNHNLSSQAQILLDDLSNKKISIIETINKINEWKSKAVEENQFNFLEDLEKLAYKFA